MLSVAALLVAVVTEQELDLELEQLQRAFGKGRVRSSILGARRLLLVRPLFHRARAQL